MPPISAVICCGDSEATLEAACRSVRWADELVVVDSGSTDRTPEIARRFADRYEVTAWVDYTTSKRHACSLASHDWVLLLDSDEECSTRLAEQLQRLSEDELAGLDLLTAPRRNHVMGRYVRAWSPDRQSRVFHKGRIRWADDVLHDARLAPPERTRHLSGWIEHKRTGSADFGDYFGGARMDARLLEVARQMHARGRRVRWWDLAVRPRVAFWKFYLLKGGLRDGAFGLMIAQKAAWSTQLKYAALWAVQHGVADES